MPKFPLVAAWTSLMVTLFASMSRLQGMYRPLSTAPFPVTSTSLPEALQAQPGPLEIWPGTVLRVVPLSAIYRLPFRGKYYPSPMGRFTCPLGPVISARFFWPWLPLSLGPYGSGTTPLRRGGALRKQEL